MEYCQKEQMISRLVFLASRDGIYHRSSIHKDMKRLCQGASVRADIVIPQQRLDLAASESVVQILLTDPGARSRR